MYFNEIFVEFLAIEDPTTKYLRGPEPRAPRDWRLWQRVSKKYNNLPNCTKPQ